MKIDKNLEEYLIEVTLNDTNLQGFLDSLIQIGFKLDKSFRPKQLKVKSQTNSNNNFLIKGTLSQKVSSILKSNHNIANLWQCSGIIPF